MAPRRRRIRRAGTSKGPAIDAGSHSPTPTPSATAAMIWTYNGRRQGARRALPRFIARVGPTGGGSCPYKTVMETLTWPGAAAGGERAPPERPFHQPDRGGHEPFQTEYGLSAESDFNGRWWMGYKG